MNPSVTPERKQKLLEMLDSFRGQLGAIYLSVETDDDSISIDKAFGKLQLEINAARDVISEQWRDNREASHPYHLAPSKPRMAAADVDKLFADLLGPSENNGQADNK